MSGQDRFKLATRARRSQGTDEFFRDLKREAGQGDDDVETGLAEPVEGSVALEEGAVTAAAAPPEEEVVSQSPPEEEARPERRSQAAASVRPPRVASLPRAGAPADFAEFERRWKPHLKPKQMAVCREIFASTAAVGRESYETTGPKLADAVGVKRRQITNLLIQLEEKGFIERETVKVKKQNKGLLIRFHPIPPKFLIP